MPCSNKQDRNLWPNSTTTEPAAYLLSPEVYESMLERLNADLRAAIQDGIDSGTAISAADVFAGLGTCYAEPGNKRAAKTNGKRSA